MKIGLYVHIPFCKSKCYYCDFLSFPKQDKITEYVDVLVRELEQYSEQINGAHTIGSIFIGGGTPTVLPPFLLNRVCQTIKERFTLEADYEWTIEANPGTLTNEHIQVITDCGINRVSLGLQSCQNHLLRAIGRTHQVADWEETIKKLQQAGITNLNTDVMFGLPGQTIQDFKDTLEQVSGMGIPHISAYSLIIEEDTVFYKQYEAGKLILPDEETEREMYTVAKSFLSDKGYKQYEISNWAKDGRVCKHNVLYWQVEPYIGCGLGAHGYLKGVRYSNTTSMAHYLASEGALEGIVVEQDRLTKKMAMEEFMFLGLRMIEGISINQFEKHFGESVFEIYGDVLGKWIKQGILVQATDSIFLSERGIEVSNQVFSSFL